MYTELDIPESFEAIEGRTIAAPATDIPVNTTTTKTKLSAIQPIQTIAISTIPTRTAITQTPITQTPITQTPITQTPTTQTPTTIKTPIPGGGSGGGGGGGGGGEAPKEATQEQSQEKSGQITNRNFNYKKAGIIGGSLLLILAAIIVGNKVIKTLNK